MKKRYKGAVFLLFFVIAVFLLVVGKTYEVKGEDVQPFDPEPDISIVPDLNISRFAPYEIEATGIPATPNTVSLKIDGLNGDGGACWDYFADGSCGSESVYKEMTFVGGKYVSAPIFPDNIYPEIYFADSETSWYNTPSEMIIRRNDYHIMHFNNPFTMVSDMSFFIEFDADPVSNINSADLQVFLVEKEQGIEFFNENWLNDVAKRVELVGTFSKNSLIHHRHTDNSSHRIVQLATDINGNIGAKELNLNGDFWIVLYSNSPNNNRGWRFKYHGASLCNNTNQWYRANQSGWATAPQPGCPDAHIHIARRNLEKMDGVDVVLRAEYAEETLVSQTHQFFFGELPNLPPSSTSFITPTVGGTYAGEINIEWVPATDPNNDLLEYNIFLHPAVGDPITFATGTSSTTLPLVTTSYDDGDYSLSGEVCDSINPCVGFALDGVFTISNDSNIQSVSSITLASSNQNSFLARIGDMVTLAFVTSGPIDSPEVNIFSGGDDVQGVVGSSNNNIWMFNFVVNSEMSPGDITFTIMSDSLDMAYFETTDESGVVLDASVRNYTLSYSAGTGGSVSGNLTQTVSHGEDGTSVTASPNEGFVFLSWSDDVEAAVRQDRNVTNDISVLALFTSLSGHDEEELVGSNNDVSEASKNDLPSLLAKTGREISKVILISLISLCCIYGTLKWLKIRQLSILR